MDQSKTTAWQISGISNKDLEAENINKISELEAKYEAMLPAARKYIETLKRLENHTFNLSEKRIFQNYYFEPRKDITITVQNGYMCILAGVFYSDGADRPFCYYAETVYYDLINGKEIPFEELFYEGVDIDEALYKLLTDKPLGSYNQGFFLLPITYNDITKLTSTDHFAMTFNSIYFNYNNPIFCVGEIYNISLDKEYLCYNEPNDMDNIFDNDVHTKMLFTPTHSYPIYENVVIEEKYEIRVKLLDETDEFGERNKKIHDYVRKYITETYSVDNVKEYVKRYYSSVSESEVSFFYYTTTFGLTGYSDDFVVLYRNNIELLFDGKTGEVIEFSDLLKDGWQDNINIFKSGEYASSGYRQHTPEETAEIDKNRIPENAKLIALSDNIKRSSMVGKKLSCFGL